MTYESVHTNDQGKHPGALYYCEVTGDFSDEWVTSLFPRAYGKSVTAMDITRVHGATRWLMLISNRRQTTCADIVNRVRDRGISDADITVQVKGSVTGTGEADRTGTPRTGTKRARKNATHHTGVAAQ